MNLCHFVLHSPDSNYVKSHSANKEKEARNINGKDLLLTGERWAGLCECQVVP